MIFRHKFAHQYYLLLRLLLLFAFFTVCRIIFIIVNLHFFSSLTVPLFFKCLLFGLRFDASSIILFNLPLIIFHLLPVPWRDKAQYQRFLKTLFLVVNLPLIFFNLADAFIYPFILGRLTVKEIFMAETGDRLTQLIPGILQTFWYAFFLLAVLVFLIYKLYPVTRKNDVAAKYLKAELLMLVIVAPLAILGIRGGWQKIPITSLNANAQIGSELAPVVLNTPFSILNSLDKPQLAEFNFMSFEEAEKTYPCLHVPVLKEEMKKMNVVVILLESFSAEYVGALNNGKGYTPFLDSLSNEGLLFTHCYANGKISIEGIPSVLSSLPSYMDHPFISSAYATDKVNSFASILKPYGYKSAFFHGGFNGTMNFDSYARVAGYDEYYGKNEYTGNKGFNGSWGIDDEPYLQYVKQCLDTFTEPFHAAVFTLSSHHPFHMPEEYKNQFPIGKHPVLATIRYTDNALRKFFEVASKAQWFNNTVFLLCADHTGPYMEKEAWGGLEFYHIMAMMYVPGKNLKGRYNEVVQQTDFLPTVMDYLNCPGKFVGFGQSTFDSTQLRISVHDLNGIYSLIDSAYFLQYTSIWKHAYYYPTDPECKHPIENYTGAEELKRELWLKAILENYRYRLTRNKLTAE